MTEYTQLKLKPAARAQLVTIMNAHGLTSLAQANSFVITKEVLSLKRAGRVTGK